MLQPKTLFFSVMILSTMIILSSNNWFSMWMALEINMLSFILIIFSKNSLRSEALLKYFFIQTVASYIFLVSAMSYTETALDMNLAITVAMLMKLGASPFHIWLPQLADSMGWGALLLFLTWQKLAPLFIISISLSGILLLSLVLSATLGSWGGMKQTSVRKILAFSSIAHMSWMFTPCLLNSNIWAMYLGFYSMILTLLILTTDKSLISISNLSQVNYSKKINFFISILSLGGLPPFLGFFPKLMVILLTTQNNMEWLFMILLPSALINLFFYARIITQAMMNFSDSPSPSRPLIRNLLVLLNSSSIIFILP